MFRGRTCKHRVFNFDTTIESTTDPMLENTLLNDEDQSITMICLSRASKVRCVKKIIYDLENGTDRGERNNATMYNASCH